MYAAEIILVWLGGNRVDDLYRLVSNVVEEGSRGTVWNDTVPSFIGEWYERTK